MRMRLATVTSAIVLALFAVAGPVLVLWTAGYRWNQRTGRLEATGIIVVNSVPEGASIAIGEERRAENTPARITGLLPREYTLTVSLPGYRNWTQKISVEGGKTTFAEKIRLFPDRLPESIIDGPIAKLALSPDRNTIAAATVAGGAVEVWLVDAQSGVATLAQRLAGESVGILEWAPGGASLLVAIADDDRMSVSIVSSESRTDLTLPASGRVTVGWSQDDPTKLLAAMDDGERLRAWLLPSSGAAATLLYNVTSTGSGLPATVPLLKGNLVFRTDAMATTTTVSTLRPGQGEASVLARIDGGPYDLLPSPDDRFTLLNPSRSRILVADRETSEILAEVPGKDSSWTERGAEAMIAWDEVELSLVSESGEISTLARLSGGIREASWIPDASYAMLLTKSDLRAIEREPQSGTRTTTQIASFSEASAMAVTEDSVYVAATIGTKPGLYRLDLAPRTQ